MRNTIHITMGAHAYMNNNYLHQHIHAGPSILALSSSYNSPRFYSFRLLLLYCLHVLFHCSMRTRELIMHFLGIDAPIGVGHLFLMNPLR